MTYVHVAEVAAVLNSAVPRSYKIAPRRFRDALLAPRPRDLDRLLLRAVLAGRRAAAEDVRAARRRTGLSRRELASATGRTVSYVARAERAQARVDPAFVESIRALRRPVR
jgi:DNA-binding transcriptional regulator YiaG